VVHLSGNRLTSLSGIEQSGATLRVLSASDNLIARLDDALAPLAAACLRLEALSLAGNPAAALPHYRARVLAALPRLRWLDGAFVSPAEAARAPSVVQAEGACLAVLVSNACLAHKLVCMEQGQAKGFHNSQLIYPITTKNINNN
jgi:hypothetical protein